MAEAVVIIPTTGSEEVIDAINSVLTQTVDTDILLVCDGDKFRTNTEKLIEQVSNSKVKVCYLPYNTGGSGFYSHRIIAGFSHLLEHDYVMFLDQDNWFESNHVETLVKEIKDYNFDWSYSLRKVYDKDKTFLCEDNCESLGRWPAWVGEDVFLVDTSSYIYKRDFLEKIGHLWHHGWGADRRFYHILKNEIQHNNYGCTGKHTLCYRLGGNEGSVNKEFFDQGNAVMMEKYKGKYPWQVAYS